VNRLNKTWFTPGASSDQTTFRLPFVSATICPSDEKPESLETFLRRRKKRRSGIRRTREEDARIARCPIHPHQIDSAGASTFITGLIEFPELFDTFVVEKLAPPSLECAKAYVFVKGGGTLSCHAT